MSDPKAFNLEEFNRHVTETLAGGESLFIWRHSGEGSIPYIRKIAEGEGYAVHTFVISPMTLPYDLGRFAASQGSSSKKSVLLLVEADRTDNPLRTQIAAAPVERQLGGYKLPEQTRLICIGSDHIKAMTRHDQADKLLARNYIHLAFGTYKLD